MENTIPAVFFPRFTSAGFWLKRLHSLFGVVPLSFFLTTHVVSRALVLWRGDLPTDVYREALWFSPVFWLAVMLPLFLHAYCGLISPAGGRFITKFCTLLGLFFVLHHLLPLMIPTLLSPERSSLSLFYRGWPKLLIECIGGAALVMDLARHLCIGLFVWGVTVSRTSQIVMARLVWSGAVLLLVAMELVFLEQGGVL